MSLYPLYLCSLLSSKSILSIRAFGDDHNSEVTFYIPLVFVFFFSFCGSENYFWKDKDRKYQ